MNISKKNSFQPYIVTKDNVVHNENLPYKIVYYPGFYGAFFGFKQTQTSPLYLCSCAREAIENYIHFRLLGKFTNSEPTRNFILDSMYFPFELVTNLIEHNAKQDNSIINDLLFKDKLCHECNNSMPALRYCNPMYGGKFTQSYGWYINKQFYEYGIEPISYRIIKDICPIEIQDHMHLDTQQSQEEIRRLMYVDFSKVKELESALAKQNRNVKNIIENEVRNKFGHKKIGEAWTSETILYHLIRKIYSQYNILRHFRPRYLEGLELDVYISELNIGIEYQGIQHFEPIKHWGGLEALKKTQARDKRKQELCESNGITLVYFYYHEELTEELIKSRI